MTKELSTERAIEVLYTVRAYYASLTAGYPKGKDCRGIGDVMCSEIANSCLMAIKALESQSFEGKTNGDVIRALFPNISIVNVFGGDTWFKVDNSYLRCSESWWNSPYKESDKSETN